MNWSQYQIGFYISTKGITNWGFSIYKFRVQDNNFFPVYQEHCRPFLDLIPYYIGILFYMLLTFEIPSANTLWSLAKYTLIINGFINVIDQWMCWKGKMVSWKFVVWCFVIIFIILNEIK